MNEARYDTGYDANLCDFSSQHHSVHARVLARIKKIGKILLNLPGVLFLKGDHKILGLQL